MGNTNTNIDDNYDNPSDKEIRDSINKMFLENKNNITTSDGDLNINMMTTTDSIGVLSMTDTIEGGYRRRNFKPSYNKYEKYNIANYLNKLRQLGGGDQQANEDVETSTKKGLEELKNIVQDMNNEPQKEELEYDLLSAMNGGGNPDEVSSSLDVLSDPSDDDYKLNLSSSSEPEDEGYRFNLSSSSEPEDEEYKFNMSDSESGNFSTTSSFPDNQTEKSYYESSITVDNNSDINILPFYSSESLTERSFQHPYIKTRIDN